MKRPRKDRAQWLEGAPEFVTACRDNGGATADRFTVYIGGTLSLTAKESKDQQRFDRVEEFLAMSGSPTHPQGFSQFGEAPQFRKDNPLARLAGAYPLPRRSQMRQPINPHPKSTL
jgi:hypothetical protein